MLIFAISGFINGAVAIIFGAFVYFKNRKRDINQIFGLMSLSVAVWSVSYGFWQLSHDKEAALFWSRMLSLGSTFIPILFFHWILALLDLQGRKRKILILGNILTLILVIFSFSPFYIKDVRPAMGFPWWPQPGILYTFYILLGYFGFLIYAFSLLIKAYKISSGYKREQIKYVMIGTLVGLGGGATNFLLWYGIPILPYGNFLVALYPFILGYAISRYRLMDIRLFMGRGAIYVFSFILIILLAFLLTFLAERFFVTIPFNIAGPLILVICILFFQPILRFFEKLASKYFYYTFYSYQTVLADLGKKLVNFLDIDKLSSLIVNTLMDTMKLDRTVVLLRKKEGNYLIQKNIGFNDTNGIALIRDDFLTNYLEKTQKPLVYEELFLIIKDTTEKGKREKLKRLRDNMRKIESSVCLPLLIEEKIIGMIVLGNKVSGDPYSDQDIDLLTSLANQASIAFQNAKLYNQVQDLSENLQEKVDIQTKELKKAYDELKELDNAKSEFLSIASHQLRTPLTAIKGYVALLLGGSYGKITKKSKIPIENINKSSERLIKLVNELLNVSRIEAGKMEINFEQVSLEEVINSVIEELKYQAESKKLYLKKEEPKVLIPKISIDKDKIKQAIMNVLDNAIKYTNKGGIIIKTKTDNSKITVEIFDTGEGMTQEEIHKLFKSFSRGSAGSKFFVDGTGLGLFIARRFIEIHGGKIWAESPGKGKGSAVFIELPIKTPKQQGAIDKVS